MNKLQNLPSILAWLSDAPLFIDADLVDRFHDAIIQPEFEDGEIRLSLDKEKASKIGGKLDIGVDVSPGKVTQWLSTLLPFLDAKLKGDIEGQTEMTKRENETKQVVLRRIKTPQRQLIQLILHYLLNHESRLILLSDPSKIASLDTQDILAVPRALAFVDLPAGTTIIPTAAEFVNNKIVQLFLRFQKENGEYPPKYPETGEAKQLREDRKKYWNWFNENVRPSKAMIVVEEAASENGQIRWIDYRVLLSENGDTIHLHVCPAGQYDTGVLAYNMVKRGQKHGLRLVGTLKSEPDLNVLAIYEK